MSFDVEEHFQVSAFWSESRRQEWDRLETRVARNTRRLADILAGNGVKATFFILGWVAERHPSLVKDLAREGHEIASHGYGHELVNSQSADQFRRDVRQAKDVLENLTGMPILGYRAPSFSITEQTPWAIPTLVEEGYRYDSSVYRRFQRSDGTVNVDGSYCIETPAGPLWEVPPSTMKVGGLQLPVAGGGYFRLTPYAVSKWCLGRLERRGARLVMYLHPWEIDPDQPRMQGPWLSRLRHYLNLHKTEERLARLLIDFRFAPIRDTISELRSESPAAHAAVREQNANCQVAPTGV